MADYVIVGAGSAGCALAGRLSEDADVEVVLVEAGGLDDSPDIRVPAAFPIVFKSTLDWDLLGEQEPGLGNRRLYLPRGRCIGGSSSINAMIYLRGHRADFDGWAADGAAGWSYDDVLPYFKRSEDNERGASDYHGAGGPLAVADGRSLHPLIDAMLAASVEAGYAHIDDLNVPEPEGVSRFQLTQRGGLRCSSADAFLHPAAGRPNLTIVTDAFTERVVFEGDRAVGVEVVRDGRRETIRAEREVILSAGSYQSPVILMHSGIGPADDLALFGMTVREDLPVGKNLQDHCMVQLNYLSSTPALFGVFTPENFALLEAEGRGPLTSNIPEAGGFFKTQAGLEAPDVEFHYAPSLFYDEGLTAPHDHGYCFGPVVIKPAGRGRVSLRTPRPDSKPLVYMDFLTTEEDRRSVIEGLRIALAIAEQPSLKAVERGPFSVPDSDSDEDLLAFARRAGQSVYHPTSTCAIGSVVDPELRVYGTEGLRVVDASVMPTITRANTNAATIMIAEKAADLIRLGTAAPALKGATA